MRKRNRGKHRKLAYKCQVIHLTRKFVRFTQHLLNTEKITREEYEKLVQTKIEFLKKS